MNCGHGEPDSDEIIDTGIPHKLWTGQIDPKMKFNHASQLGPHECVGNVCSVSWVESNDVIKENVRRTNMSDPEGRCRACMTKDTSLHSSDRIATVSLIV